MDLSFRLKPQNFIINTNIRVIQAFVARIDLCGCYNIG